jgi:hypothetical protein
MLSAIALSYESPVQPVDASSSASLSRCVYASDTTESLYRYDGWCPQDDGATVPPPAHPARTSFLSAMDTPTAHDTPGEHIDDERQVHEALPGAEVMTIDPLQS